MNRSRRALFLGISIALLLIIPLSSTLLYVVNERELAVVLQFGEPVAERTEPGLYFKVPFVQEVRRLPKTYQYWEGNAPDEKLVDVTTRDSKKIEATIWALWRITDPGDFVRTLRTVENAETRVKEFVRSNARDVLTRNDLAEIVRSTNRDMSLTLGLPETALTGDDQESIEVVIEQAMAPEARQSVETGRKELMDQIRLDAQGALGATNETAPAEAPISEATGARGRGIVLVDVGLARVEFVPEVRNAAFERLIALMEAIATKNRSEGEQRKQEIINRAASEAESIRGEGSEQSNRLRGEVEAKITEEFAAAIEESAGFYEFNRTLELYKKALRGNGTRFVLGTDNTLLRLLTDSATERADPVGSPGSTGTSGGEDSGEPTSLGTTPASEP